MSLLNGNGSFLSKQSDIALPFKPFTADEVKAITGAPNDLIDHWGNVIGLKRGEVGFEQGFEWMGCFAVFVGWRWVQEGAGLERATPVVKCIANMAEGNLRWGIREGKDFPAPGTAGPTGTIGYLVAPTTKLMRKLRLKDMLAEFESNVKRVFPKG